MKTKLRVLAVLLTLALIFGLTACLTACETKGPGESSASTGSDAGTDAGANKGDAGASTGTGDAGTGTGNDADGGNGNGSGDGGNGGDNGGAVTVNMTDSYAAARTSFHTISGIWLPELADVEMLPSSDFNERFMTACFDIEGTAELLTTFRTALTAVLGAPDAAEEGVYCNWSNVEFLREGTLYGGWLSAALNTDYTPAQIYVNFSASEVENSYAVARDFFEAATGMHLPAWSGLEVNFGFGTTSFMFDIVDGDECDKFTYEDFEDYFDGKLPTWEKTGPAKADREYNDGFIDLQYSDGTGNRFMLDWDGYNEAIYINAFFNNPSFAPYAKIKAIFRELSGITLPDYTGVVVKEYSQDFFGGTMNITADNLTYDDYLALETLFIENLGACRAGYPDGDEAGRDAQWRTTDWLFSITWTPAGLDHNDQPTPPAIDFNVSVLIL